MLSPVFAILILAGSGSQPAQADGDAEAKKSERKVCQVYEQIGSRLGNRRVCMTARQWEQKQQEQRADVERAQSNVGIKSE